MATRSSSPRPAPPAPRSELGAAEIQKVLPGANPVKAIQTLPGVQFETADPWGNNEQNIALFVHGFNQNQLGFTLDGVPLGDQSYGNYNGLSPQRAVISENVARVRLTAGAPIWAPPRPAIWAAGSRPIRAIRPRHGHPLRPNAGQLRRQPHLPAHRQRRGSRGWAAPTAVISRSSGKRRAPGNSTPARAGGRAMPSSSTRARTAR